MIKLNNIGKKYGSNVILENITFEFKDSGFYFLLGKSGSGKTTLLNLIGGLETCSTGEIERDGDVCYVFQEYNLLTDFTVYENIKITGIDDEEIDEILKTLDIFELKNKVLHFLSGGEKQRVAIGRALAMGGQILLLDEPTGNLDEQNTNQILEILKEISKTRLVIMATHDMDLADKYGDVVLAVKNKGLTERIQSEPVVGNAIKSVQDKKKLFTFKFQFLYAIKLIKSRPIKYVITVLLSMFSLLLLFMILNITFYDEEKVIQKCIASDQRDLYSISKDYYNEPTDEYLSFNYGLEFEKDLSAVYEIQDIAHYKTVIFPNLKYQEQTAFNMIIVNEDFEGVKITDFIAKYVFDSQDCIGKTLEISFDSFNYQLPITELKNTDYAKIYELYFFDNYYRNLYSADFSWYYGVVYISLNTYKELIASHYINLVGANFTLNNLSLKDYMLSYYSTSFGSDKSLSGSEVGVSKNFYEKFMNNKALPATYQVRDVYSSINKNLYINKLNFYDIFKEVNVVKVVENAECDVLISEELFNNLVEKYYHFAVDGICLNDNLNINKLHKSGFTIGDSDIHIAYLLNEILNQTLKIVFLVVSLIIAIISLLALYFSIAGFMDKKSKEFFILKSLGVSKNKILSIFIIYTVLVVGIGLIFALLFGNLALNLLNGYLNSEVFYIKYNLFIFEYQPYLVIFGLVLLTGILILLNPLLSLKKIDIATLVKLNN